MTQTPDGDQSSKFYNVVLSENDKNRLLNSKAVDEVLLEVIRMCMELDLDMKVDEHLNKYLKKKQQGNKNDRDWHKIYGSQVLLGYKKCDSTLLYSLIPEICQKITRYNPAMCLDTSLEFSLKCAKNIRNEVMHNIKGAALSSQTIQKISNAAFEIVTRAGEHFSLSKSDIRKKLTWVSSLIKNVKESPFSEKLSRASAVANEVEQEYSERSQKYCAALISDRITFSAIKIGRSAVFHPVKLKKIHRSTLYSIECDDVCEKATQILCTDIFQYKLENQMKVIFIVGDPGSGKSSFTKQILLDHSRIEEEPKFRHIEDYSLLIEISCRERNAKNLKEYLQTNYIKLCSRFGYDSVLAAIRNRQLLFLIDGLDEINEISQSFVDDVIETFKWDESVEFIITSRLGCHLDLIQRLEAIGIDHEIFEICKIKDQTEQVQFLTRYQENIPDIDSSGLIPAFKEMQNRFSNHFVHPITLALFCHIYRNFPSDIMNMSNVAKLMEYTLKLCKHQMEVRIQQTIHNNFSYITREVIKTLSLFCLQWLNEGVFQIDEEDYNKLEDKCLQINQNIPIKACISCILQENRSLSSSDFVYYIFFHTSLQEYLACLCILEQMGEKKMESVPEMISRLVGEPVQQGDLKK